IRKLINRVTRSTLIFEAADEQATAKFGSALADVLPACAVVALVGPLGAGKTRLVQAVAQAAGVPDGVVASPPFVVVPAYKARTSIFHLDVYRLRDEDEFLGLGAEEYFAQEGWSFIEWAARVAECLPRERLQIPIDSVGRNARRFPIRGVGEKYEP